MRTVYAIHAPDQRKLEMVKAEMQTLGVPTIRVIDCGDYYMAIEGSHRLAAAADLGITPNLIVLEQDSEIDLATTDLDWTHNFSGQHYQAGELAYELHGMHNPVYRF
jgi:hypothetical protein